MTAAVAVVKQQLRIIRRDPWFLLVMFGMPMVVMPLFKKTMAYSLQASGYANATGAEQVVPGQMVMFGFFVGGSAGFCLFREHGWGTWDRLRASNATPPSLLVGFIAPWVAILTLFQLGLLLAGGAAAGLRLRGGSPIAELLVIVSYSFVIVTLVMLVSASLRTVNQVNAFQNVGAMAFAGLGGAFAPLAQLPGWARAIAPATPSYWAMQGHNAVFLEQGGIADVAKPVGVLIGASIVLFVIATKRFRLDETKQFFA